MPETTPFEAIIEGLEHLPDTADVDGVPLADVLSALVRAAADAQLATDRAASEAVTEDGPWPDGVLPAFYQIAEVAIDLTLDIRFAVAGDVLSARVRDPGGGSPAGAPVRVVLRHVPPPAAVLANLPAASHAGTPSIHID